MIDVTSRMPETALSARPRRCTGTMWRAGQLLASAAMVAMTVAACSSWSALTGSNAPDPAAAPSDGSFTSRVRSFFSGDSGRLNPASSSTTGSAGASAIDCPNVEYRQGAATWAVNGPATESAAFSLRYQGSFVQTARECILNGGNVTIKVGVQGRVVVGPAGTPGTVNVPLRYALVREGLEPKTLWTKLFMVPVSIPAGQLNQPWIHVEEEMTVPRPSDQDLEAYVIYIGFDPEGSAPARPAAKPRAARAR
jgi:hypothetical protein